METLLGILILGALSIYLIILFSKSKKGNPPQTNRDDIWPLEFTRKEEDYNDSIDIAKTILEDKNKYVILDTETTGLGNNDVIIQIGMIDLDGNILLDSLIKPTKRKRISREATNIHGITMKMLYDAPTFEEIYPKFKEIVGDKKILIYNAEFDVKLIEQTADQDEFVLNEMMTVCMMKLYSGFIGEWSEYHGDWKFQKLKGGDHSAIGDCKATLETIKKVASAEKILKPN